MDYDINNLFIGGLSIGNHYMWGSAGSGKSQISTMYFSKLNGKWRGEYLEKKFNSPFKKA